MNGLRRLAVTTMDQEEILDSMKSHLDGLNSVVTWALLLAIVFWWAGIQNEEIIDALGMKIHRGYALWVAVAFYLCINLVLLDHLWRVGDLINLTDEAHLSKMISRIALHPWTLNPFSYFGDAIPSRLHSAKGFGALIVVWWVANSSLYCLSRNVMSPLGLLLQGTFLGIGLASMLAINRVFSIVLKRTEISDPMLHEKLKATRIERSLLTFAGIGLGGFFAFITQVAGRL